MKLPNVLRIITVISFLLLGACSSSTRPGTPGSDALLMKEPVPYIVVYISDQGVPDRDPAVLIVDATKNQEIYFISAGTNLDITFNDSQQFKVKCGGRRCTAKLDPDKPHQNLFDYKYKIKWTNRQGVRNTVDPVVIIDEIQQALVP